MLHASLSVCALSEPKVLHWSTALGMQPCIRERQRDLLQRGRLLLLATQITETCFPGAVDAIHKKQYYEDDHSFAKFTGFARSQHIEKREQESAEEYVQRAGKELNVVCLQLTTLTIAATSARNIRPLCLISEPGGCFVHG